MGGREVMVKLSNRWTTAELGGLAQLRMSLGSRATAAVLQRSLPQRSVYAVCYGMRLPRFQKILLKLEQQKRSLALRKFALDVSSSTSTDDLSDTAGGADHNGLNAPLGKLARRDTSPPYSLSDDPAARVASASRGP